MKFLHLIAALVLTCTAAAQHAALVYPPTKCVGPSLMPFAVADPTVPGLRVGIEHHITFWTTPLPGSMPTQEACWLIYGTPIPPAPLDPLGMPGCWLLASLEGIVPIPVTVGWSGHFLREPVSHERMELRWTPSPAMLGYETSFQLLVSRASHVTVSNPLGLIVGPAIRTRVGI